MNFLKNLLGKKDIRSYSDFWAWFQSNERQFYNVIKTGGDVEKEFFRKLSPKLAELRDGYYYLTGMINDHTAELVLTADGEVKNFVFVEELVASAPSIAHWKFTALKPALDMTSVNINMHGFQFNQDNLSFFTVDHPDRPDEIDIVIAHPDLNDHNKNQIANGIYIFLDNCLGELNAATTIDHVNIEKKDTKDLIPISKLKEYLTWRQKEFIEKYEGIRHDTGSDNYSLLEARLENGNPVVATMNTDLLKWDRKASHPWILKMELKYPRGNEGMPDTHTYALLDDIENEINNKLQPADGYLNIGRQTGDSVREIYYTCKDFRKPALVAANILQGPKDNLEINYHIYKDKYWRTFDRFTRK